MRHLVIDNDSERLLILSDSLISNSWKCNNEWQHPGTEKLGPVKGHINMEVKRGATISDLTNILIEKYLNVDHMSFICWRFYSFTVMRFYRPIPEVESQT